ncbi:MAG: GPH family glycoside/pentoside/hexuronide:cation symporter [Arenicella sp.]|jgi:GPH family glycoside/pentoside/hexuronide:cation symporter
MLGLSNILSAILPFIIAPMVSRKIGKRQGALTFGLLAAIVFPAPVILRLFRLLPENGDPALFPIVLGFGIVSITLVIANRIFLLQ